jgi:hypothetical protein
MPSIRRDRRWGASEEFDGGEEAKWERHSARRRRADGGGVEEDGGSLEEARVDVHPFTCLLHVNQMVMKIF